MNHDGGHLAEVAVEAEKAALGTLMFMMFFTGSEAPCGGIPAGGAHSQESHAGCSRVLHQEGKTLHIGRGTQDQTGNVSPPNIETRVGLQIRPPVSQNAPEQGPWTLVGYWIPHCPWLREMVPGKM